MSTRIDDGCPPACWETLARSRRLPVWDSHGPGPVAVLIWGPVLLVEPVAQGLSDRGFPWGLPAAVAALAFFVAAALLAYRVRPARPATVTGLLFAQTAVTVAATAILGPHWYSLLVLLALAWSSVAAPRWAPTGVLAVTLGGAALVWFTGNGWDRTWTTALTTFLAGFGTYTFHRLLTAVAVLHATRQQLARQAVDDERLRFSRDLHDLLGHTLSVVVVKAEAVRRLVPVKPDDAARHAADIERIGREALVEVREAVTGYRDTGLPGELDRARTALRAAGIEASVDTVPVPDPAADALFGWVVREAVTNVVRHSAAEHCRITVAADGDHWRLDVVDDGDGGPDSVDGKGLRGLAERAAGAGAELAVVRGVGGFRVTVALTRQRAEETV